MLWPFSTIPQHCCLLRKHNWLLKLISNPLKLFLEVFHVLYFQFLQIEWSLTMCLVWNCWFFDVFQFYFKNVCIPVTKWSKAWLLAAERAMLAEQCCNHVWRYEGELCSKGWDGVVERARCACIRESLLWHCFRGSPYCWSSKQFQQLACLACLTSQRLCNLVCFRLKNFSDDRDAFIFNPARLKRDEGKELIKLSVHHSSSIIGFLTQFQGISIWRMPQDMRYLCGRSSWHHTWVESWVNAFPWKNSLK